MVSLHSGDRLDHYQIEGVVARSGMASIFRGRDLNNGRSVAIKVPHPEMESDPVLFDRFQREEEIGAAMDHPGVMKVFAEGGRSQLYMVMEWVDGRLLRKVLSEESKLPSERVIRLVRAVLEALEYIHANGVVHRDLKPENIMVAPDDRVKLIDFGIASKAGARRLTFAKFTQTMGTPDYISPEQIKGKSGDARSDLYAVGVMLYEMLTGTTPFKGPNPFAIMNDRLLNNPMPPRECNPEISPELQEIIYRALEREPKNRYQSAREFIWDLDHMDQVTPSDRAELHDWHQRRTPWVRRILVYAMLALIPALIFGLLLYVAKH